MPTDISTASSAASGPPQFLRLEEALRVFATATSTQGQDHIKPLHRYIAARLVLEGGFLPDEITPHPPLKARQRSSGWILEYAPEDETKAELTVFGGMKTKQIDVVAAKPGIGPVIAVSVKGTVNAYRNLVNRMEEAIGDSTNVHVMYPGLVYGFLHLVRANRHSHGYDNPDAGVTKDGKISPYILRYYAALSEMVGRRFVRNDFTRYESVALVMVENDPASLGRINDEFPVAESSVRLELFFSRLFDVYDFRFPFRAENLPIARRVEWLVDSPFLKDLRNAWGDDPENVLGYRLRLTDG